jgi:hypothetical protein
LTVKRKNERKLTKMAPRNLHSIVIVSFLLVFLSQVTTAKKNKVRRRETPGVSPIYDVQLTVANQKHYNLESDVESRFETRIIGGSPTDPLEYPYFTDLGGCGATLIAPNVILSAGKTFK